MRTRGLYLPLAAAVATALLAWFFAERWATASARAELDQTLLLTARAVEAEVDRLRALPDVAAEDARIRDALAGTGSLDAANRYLEAVSAHADASELFLIDANGLTIAASNWNRPGSFVGHDYGFRPYFRDAMANETGQFYAIGVTTGVPGYFLSTRITSGDRTGVLVVKLDLRPLQQTWRAAGAQVALADVDGVVFLSGAEDWLYRPLSPLSPEVLERIGATRAYEGVSLAEAAPLLPRPPLGQDAIGNGWLARIVTSDATGWHLIAAWPERRITIFAAGWAMVAALVSLAAAAGGMAWEQRRQIVALRLSQSERLESMVIARTADLAREVDARRQAEASLRTAQEVLIHTEKMAALGRMSTAIVHELSQPLAAMEATLAAAGMSVGKDDAQIAPRLATARGLIRRMQRTTKHLKSFGRKEAGELSLIDLRPAIASALELVTPRARAVGAMPTLEMPDQPVAVLAGSVRIEQVAVNLILNALDAVEGRKGASVGVVLSIEDDKAKLSVRDTGHGIAEEDVSKVAEPFFSTKVTGEGLGLGLAICKAIIADFRGDLVIVSRDGQGTEVIVTLPLARSAQEDRAAQERPAEETTG